MGLFSETKRCRYSKSRLFIGNQIAHFLTFGKFDYPVSWRAFADKLESFMETTTTHREVFSAAPSPSNCSLTGQEIHIFISSSALTV